MRWMKYAYHVCVELNKHKEKQGVLPCFFAYISVFISYKALFGNTLELYDFLYADGDIFSFSKKFRLKLAKEE